MKTLNFENSYAKNEQGNIIGPITQQKMAENDGTAVTVICITYNHEKFIAQALDSFLMQKTNFKFKVFVGEDCGPDKTADIVREYAEKYPDIIIPFIREHNMGAQRNLIDLCQRAASPYIAFCEGDDYWIDEYKLQKQFDYMEQNQDIRICFAQAEIEAPDDWFLRNYFIADQRGKLILPNCEPVFGKYFTQNRYIKGNYFVSFTACHTSTMFFRWNYDLKIPEWYFDGLIGDISIFLLQLGDGETLYINHIVSVYRRSDVGVWMNTNMNHHFLKTRLSYINLWINFLDYVKECNLKNYSTVTIENRIKLEVTNYLSSAIKCNDYKYINNFFSSHPEAAKITLTAYLSFYRDSRLLIKSYGWESYKLIVRNRYYRNLLKPYAKIVFDISKIKSKIKKILKNIISWSCYWVYSFVPKKKNIWCFSGFNKKTYMDNTKYLYEWVIENHPEINAYWLTMDDMVYKRLKDENKPVLKMRTWDCIKKLAQASIAITDHFRMSDYDNYSGFNNKIKVVQLWHGVSTKNMGDGTNVINTTVPGVVYSYDILAESNDNFCISIIKKLKYILCAHKRELFEKYFMFVMPGKAQVEMIAKKWNVNKEAWFICGHPRNIKLYNKKIPYNNVIYAPTYRWNPNREKEMIEYFISYFPKIQNLMEKIEGTFTLRLHPHTWRNYSLKILDAMKNYNRIKYDSTKDVYQNLYEYGIMISDYSSIAWDFAMLDRPVVFLCGDYEKYMKEDAGFSLDYYSNTPGVKALNWDQVLSLVEDYFYYPQRDVCIRKRVCEYFFDPHNNDVNNSERIVTEIKKRLG